MINSQSTVSMDKLAINVPELAKMLGVSRPVAYELTKREGFPAIRISERRIIIPVDKLNEWLARESCAAI